MNLPNALSIFRLILAPVFPLVFYSSHRPLAVIVYVVASATDVLDGYLARRFQQITRLGRILDPLADKLMSAAVLICLAFTYPVLRWAVLAFVVKEGCMGLGALIQYKKIADVPPSTPFGKFSALYLFSVCVVVLVFPYMTDVMRHILVWTAVAMTILALALYFLRFVRTMRAADKNQGE